MFSSNHYIEDVNDIPPRWIFENYLDLNVPLNGNRVRIKSLFNPADKTPSMFIYYNRDCNCYKFKCFSTGKGGGAVDLMMHIWNVDFKQTCDKIIKDYSDYLKDGKSPEKQTFDLVTWVPGSFEHRKWTTADAKYWSQFNIGSDLLEEHGVYPLKSYKMFKYNSDDTIVDSFEICGNHIYGFYDTKGNLCKIYQPYKKERKFIKITDYLQGSDQLKANKYLVIASSLKDIMTIKSLGFRVDVVAPHSENTLISSEIMKTYKKLYKAVVSVLDSDQAGINAMKEYEEAYGVPFCYLPLEKDISDIVKHHGKDVALRELSPKLDRAIEKYLQKN